MNSTSFFGNYCFFSSVLFCFTYNFWREVFNCQQKCDRFLLDPLAFIKLTRYSSIWVLFLNWQVVRCLYLSLLLFRSVVKTNRRKKNSKKIGRQKKKKDDVGLVWLPRPFNWGNGKLQRKRKKKERKKKMKRTKSKTEMLTIRKIGLKWEIEKSQKA